MLSDKEVRISRKMSCGLRHNPGIFGVELGAQVWDGFVPIASVCKALGISRESLDLVVREDSKQRFAVKEDLIRASQGHSVPVDLGCEVKTPPDSLYHGTSCRAWEKIKVEGLNKMKRHAVHLSPSYETAVQVGTRYAKRVNHLVILVVDTLAMVAEGYEFRVSDNGVWLIDRVPPEFLSVMEASNLDV